jgi:hypothetical protein
MIKQGRIMHKGNARTSQRLPSQKAFTESLQFQLGLQWISPWSSYISLDEGTQSRVKENLSKIRDYGRLMAEENWDWQKSQYQPITLFWDTAAQKLWCGDGHHRIKAARQESLEEIYVDIRLGTVNDAKILNCIANATHGIRTTRQDKRNQIRILLITLNSLTEDERRKWSDRYIARRIGVDHKTVGKIRQQIAAAPQKVEVEKTQSREFKLRQKRNINRLNLVTDELDVEGLVKVLKTLSPSKVSKLKEAVQYLEAVQLVLTTNRI